MKGIKAIHDEKGYAELNGARHPLIDPKNVVPLHIRLGRDFHILIITGSNAGGKTISMKTLGLLALMNQPGCSSRRKKVPVSLYTDISTL